MRDTILARQREGATISVIAKELGVSRPTVYKALSIVDNWESWVKDKSSNITRLAYNCVERGLERGDARLGLDWLKCTVFSPERGDTYNINADQVLVTGTAMMPSRTVPSSTTSAVLDVLPAVATGTEAGANPTPNDIGLSSHTNFSQFSTPDLIAELARRGVEVK